MAIENLTHQSPSGAALNVYVREPEKPARAVLQINHGLA